MGYQIVTPPPVLNSKRTELREPESESATPQDTSSNVSTNAAYAMKDVPESEKHKVTTPQEATAALNRGELMYGPIPNIPVLSVKFGKNDESDGIKFDFNDGFRFYVPNVEEGKEKKKYLLYLLESRKGVVLHHGIVESGAFITTLQKYYCEYKFTVIKQVSIPEKLKEEIKRETEYDDVIIDELYKFATSPEMTDEILTKEMLGRHHTFNKDAIAKAGHKLLEYVNENLVFTHQFDTTDQTIMVQLPVGTIGDSIGWFAYIERFQQKTKGKVICVMNPNISCLFEKQYPDITFIPPKDTLKYTPYACYRIGLFFKGDTNNQPYDFRYIGNHRTASKILDVNDDDIAPRADLSAPREIKEPYVCIAVQGSAYCKMWTNPTGWRDVVKHLNEIGYRVLCIDKDATTGTGIATNSIPWGAEDFTGNRPLQERINLLKDCDFFIGLSSGVSWLAWCAKCPVVMISGFTNPFNEFYTPYRVINTLFCHGCWNDERCDFDHYDFMWCPRHKGTDKAYECSRTISAKLVLNTIADIPAYQKQKNWHENSIIAKDVNDIIADEITNNGYNKRPNFTTSNICEMQGLMKEKNLTNTDIANIYNTKDYIIDFITSSLRK